MENIFKGVNAIFYSILFHGLMFPTGSSMNFHVFSFATIFCLIMVDQSLSKGVILIPCNKTITSEDTACLLLENLYKWFGLPNKIISDRGPQFTSKAFKELLRVLEIKLALSTAYHPQTDGITKWVNQEIEAYLSIYCASHLEEWPQALHTFEFTHNNQCHADRQNTPF